MFVLLKLLTGPLDFQFRTVSSLVRQFKNSKIQYQSKRCMAGARRFKCCNTRFLPCFYLIHLLDKTSKKKRKKKQSVGVNVTIANYSGRSLLSSLSSIIELGNIMQEMKQSNSFHQSIE